MNDFDWLQEYVKEYRRNTHVHDWQEVHFPGTYEDPPEEWLRCTICGETTDVSLTPEMPNGTK